MSQPPAFGLDENALLFGKIAVEAGLLTSDQVSEALMAQMENPAKTIGQHLLEQGVLTQSQLVWVLHQQELQNQPSSVVTATAVAAPAAATAVATVPPPPQVAQVQGSPANLADTQAAQVVVAPIQNNSTVVLSPDAIAAVAAETGAGEQSSLQQAVPLPSLELAQPAPPLGAVDAPAATAPVSVIPPVPIAAATAEIAPPVAAAPVAAPVVASPQGLPAADDLEAMVGYALSLGASDLHLHSGTSAKVRVHGDLAEVPGLEVSDASVCAILDRILDDEQMQKLAEQGQVDFAHTVIGKARMRCNAYRQQRGTDVVFRLVAPRPPTLEELSLPDTLSKMGDYHQGMVLFTGPTGCGKTSTLAALLSLVNQGKSDHILTVEDPIEYIHPSLQCIVNQRQVGGHTSSFARALRGALREDPDVIVIGELRDLETISLALTAAETGHLVLATMHTMNAIATINRLIGAFPPEEQSQIRTMVSESLRAIVSQRLVKRADGAGRIPALEVLVANTAISNLIREQKTFQIPGIMQSGSAHGMCLLDMSLKNLLKTGAITKEEARINANNPKAFD